MSETDAALLQSDLQAIGNRLPETGHSFYLELIGSLSRTLMYDLFAFHKASRKSVYSSDRSLYVVKELMQMLESGLSLHHRSVDFYARSLHVTPKYLSDTVRRQTGHSVSYFIDRATVPLIKQYLDNPQYSIAQIAEIMQFGSPAYFSRYVSQRLGMSPRQYRSSLTPL